MQAGLVAPTLICTFHGDLLAVFLLNGQQAATVQEVLVEVGGDEISCRGWWLASILRLPRVPVRDPGCGIRAQRGVHPALTSTPAGPKLTRRQHQPDGQSAPRPPTLTDPGSRVTVEISDWGDWTCRRSVL
jgi:hypothetical protein